METFMTARQSRTTTTTSCAVIRRRAHPRAAFEGVWVPVTELREVRGDGLQMAFPTAIPPKSAKSLNTNDFNFEPDVLSNDPEV